MHLLWFIIIIIITAFPFVLDVYVRCVHGNLVVICRGRAVLLAFRLYCVVLDVVRGVCALLLCDVWGMMLISFIWVLRSVKIITYFEPSQS